MGNLSSVIKLVRNMDTKQMRQRARETAREANRPYPVIFADMVWCGFRYQAGYSDYALFQMWDMNQKQRSSVLTRGKNNRYVAALNSRDGWHSFDQKTDFLIAFAPFIGRRWLDLDAATPTELESFGRDLGSFIVKPKDGSHGDGVERIRGEEVDNWETLYARLKSDKRTLCEEVIQQHPDLNAIWPGSINTSRIVTILKDNKVYVVAAYLRVGNGARPVDNFNGGGMVVPLDKKTGKILTHALDKAGNAYKAHPSTGTPFEGTQVPMWQEIMELVEQAARVEPSIRYVGWDVAVTPNGPVLVEGNHFPGHDIYGLPTQAKDKMGILPDFEEVISYQSL
jgi:hypothetical protein